MLFSAACIQVARVGQRAVPDEGRRRVSNRLHSYQRVAGDEPRLRLAAAAAARCQARSTSNAARLRVSLLNSTAIRWIGWLRARYLSA